MKKPENLLACGYFALLILLISNNDIRAAQSARAITASELTPAGKTALFGYGEGTVKLIDLTTGKPVRTYSKHYGAISALAYTPDGMSFLSGGEDGVVRRWDVPSGKQLWNVNEEQNPLYPDYPNLPENGNEVRSISVTPDGKQALVRSKIGALKLRDIETGKAVVSFDNIDELMWSLNLSPDGKTAVTTSPKPRTDLWTIRLWDAATGRTINQFTDTSTAVYGAFLPDGKRLLTGGKNTLRLWDTSTGKLIRTFDDPDFIDSVALSPDGKHAFTGASDRGGGVIKVWDIETGKIIRRLAGHTRSVIDLTFSADSTQMLSASHDDSLILWNIPAGKLIRRFRENR